MKKPSDEENQNSLRDKIIGLGEKSIRKSYYPELQQRINELETANRRLKEEIAAREKMAEQQKKLEEQLHRAQKLESLGTLAGGIAHDFNNILTPILGYAELAATAMTEDCPIKADIEQIIQGALRAKELVKQILDYSRPGKGALVELNLAALAREALGLIKASMPASITIRHRLETESLILAEPTKIHQVIMNLCTNAMHAMQETGGELSIVTEEVCVTSEDARLSREGLIAGDFIKIEIADTGHGMERHILERIFDPYFTTREPGKGTGLGLSVVHSIIQNHGGFINCYSEPGGGTVFRVYFPLLKSGHIIGEAEDKAILATGNEHILVIDDEEVITTLVAKTLQALGYAVTSATDPLAALETFESNPGRFSLIISDVTMPGINGAELVRRVKNLCPTLPIILCSGFSDLINEEKARALGVNRYLMKPIIRRDLAMAVRTCLDEKKPTPA